MKCIDCGRNAGDVDKEVTEYDSSSDGEETETDVSELNLARDNYAIWAPRQVFL